MPVTPFHFGLGALAKGIAPSRVSLSAFVASQVVIDCESAYFLFIAHEWPVHRWLHTFVVASTVGLAVGVGTWALAKGSRALGWPWPLQSESRLTPCLVGGLLGGLSHPFLDGIMHSDIQPLRPFTTWNPFLGLVSVLALHVLCTGCGVLGIALLAAHTRSRDLREIDEGV